ncbi:uncharacterized protein LOC141703906 [Apium graveolens]|uniref:uncharacterized protein LOC141703906 n=1 Tax=Apium graveolens TaxID=4045 RepID=UPI003D7A852F
MASASNNSGSSSDECESARCENRRFLRSENMEKSMTNLNVNLAAVSRMVEALGESHMQFSGHMTVKQEEFNKSFKAQQQLLLEEIRLLRIEHGEIRRKMNEGF